MRAKAEQDRRTGSQHPSKADSTLCRRKSGSGVRNVYAEAERDDGLGGGSGSVIAHKGGDALMSYVWIPDLERDWRRDREARRKRRVRGGEFDVRDLPRPVQRQGGARSQA